MYVWVVKKEETAVDSRVLGERIYKKVGWVCSPMANILHYFANTTALTGVQSIEELVVLKFERMSTVGAHFVKICRSFSIMSNLKTIGGR
jgi:hypothetical protein